MTSSASSRTPRTTSGCSACASAPTSTRSCTRSAAGIDPERGWGRTDETWHAKEELAAYGEPQAWFGLGDRDLATHLVRTDRLRQGRTLTEATAELCRRWDIGVTLLPMTDAEVETHIATTVDGRDEVVHFQEYWIRHRAEVPVRGVELHGIDESRPTPEVLAAIEGSDVVLVAPSNPIVSIGPIVAVPGMREALGAARAPVVGVSPIIGGAAVRGMADQLLAGLGIDGTAAGVAGQLGARSGGGLLDGWLVDTEDAGEVDRIQAARHRGAERPALHARRRHDSPARRRRTVPRRRAGRTLMTLTLDPSTASARSSPATTSRR